jgi:hypothetical protein
MSRAIPLLPCGPFVACYGVNFTFTSLISKNLNYISLISRLYNSVNCHNNVLVNINTFIFIYGNTWKKLFQFLLKVLR